MGELGRDWLRRVGGHGARDGGWGEQPSFCSKEALCGVLSSCSAAAMCPYFCDLCVNRHWQRLLHMMVPGRIRLCNHAMMCPHLRMS